MLKFSKRLRTAYSLIELSIVLVIIATLVAGALTVSADNLKSGQVQVTKDRMNMIYAMMANYVRINKALPCPASLTAIKSSDANYGSPVGVAGTCTGTGVLNAAGNSTIVGAVPTAALGLPLEYAEDGFGSKIFYITRQGLTKADNLNAVPDFTSGTNNFSTLVTNQLSASPSSLLSVQQNPGGIAATNNAALILLSSGLNKYGAYNANSSTQNSLSGLTIDAEEVANATSAYTNSAVTSVSSTGKTFDDVVIYKTARDLVNDYPDLMNLVPCSYATIPDSAAWYTPGKTSAWYGGKIYSNKRSDCTGRPNFRYSFQCGANGNWTPLVSSCPAQGPSYVCQLAAGAFPNSNAVYDGSKGTDFDDGDQVTLKCKSGGYGYQTWVGGLNPNPSPGGGGGAGYTVVADADVGKYCGRKFTDRYTTPPTATCQSNGTWQLQRDCSPCRSCSASSVMYPDTRVAVTADGTDVKYGGGNYPGCVGEYSFFIKNVSYDAYVVSTSSYTILGTNGRPRSANSGDICTKSNLDSLTIRAAPHDNLQNKGYGCQQYSGDVGAMNHNDLIYLCQFQDRSGSKNDSGLITLRCLDNALVATASCSGYSSRLSSSNKIWRTEKPGALGYCKPLAASQPIAYQDGF